MRSHARSMIATAGLVVLLSSAFTPWPVARAGSAPELQNGASASSDYATTRQVRFREEFGLDASLGHIRAVQSNGRSPRWGLPLTAAEEAELATRARVSDELGHLQQAVEAEDGFAGIYIDQAHGGTIHIRAVPGHETRMRGLASSLAPSGADVQVDTAAFTYADLQTIRYQIRDLMIAHTFAINELSVDQIANSVRVVIDPGNLAADKAGLEAMFPGAPILYNTGARDLPAACTQDSCWPPSRGGITVKSPWVCTSTFNAKNSAGNVFLVTAGHCADENNPGTINVSFSHAGVVRGKNTVNAWKGASTYADATIIDIPNADVSNLIYVTSTTQRGMTARMGLNAGVVGDPVCANGVVTDFFCGTISDVDLDANNGVILLHQRKATIDVAQGDSGATVFYGTAIHGLVNTASGAVVKDPPKTWANLIYTQVRDVELQLNVSAVLQ